MLDPALNVGVPKGILTNETSFLRRFIFLRPLHQECFFWTTALFREFKQFRDQAVLFPLGTQVELLRPFLSPVSGPSPSFPQRVFPSLDVTLSSRDLGSAAQNRLPPFDWVELFSSSQPISPFPPLFCGCICFARRSPIPPEPFFSIFYSRLCSLPS